MMFTTIPLPSIFRSKHKCVSCDKWIRFDLFGEFNVNFNIPSNLSLTIRIIYKKMEMLFGY